MRPRLAGVALLVTLSAPAHDILDEYEAKAGFVYNIAKFVEWPASAFSSPMDPFVLCVLGESPIRPVLEQAVASRTIGSRHFSVRSISSARGTGGCSLVFVSQSAQKGWRAGLSSVSLTGILVVGESDSIDGMMINLKRSGDKIRLQVDLEATRRAHLGISSRLLSLAEVVKR